MFNYLYTRIMIGRWNLVFSKLLILFISKALRFTPYCWMQEIIINDPTLQLLYFAYYVNIALYWQIFAFLLKTYEKEAHLVVCDKSHNSDKSRYVLLHPYRRFFALHSLIGTYIIFASNKANTMNFHSWLKYFDNQFLYKINILQRQPQHCWHCYIKRKNWNSRKLGANGMGKIKPGKYYTPKKHLFTCYK